MTTCELEVDVLSDSIMNREEIEIKIGTNPGLEAIWRDENQRRRMRGLLPLMHCPESQGVGRRLNAVYINYSLFVILRTRGCRAKSKREIFLKETGNET